MKFESFKVGTFIQRYPKSSLYPDNLDVDLSIYRCCEFVNSYILWEKNRSMGEDEWYVSGIK